MAYENLTRLPDPTTTPAGPGFMSVSLTDNSTGLLHALNTGGTVGVQYHGNFWTINISYQELTQSEGDPFLAVLSSLAGGFRNFYVQIPLYTNPKTGVWDTSTSAKIALGEISLGASDREVVISSWATRGGNLSAGDMLKFTNSNKIYRVVKTTLASGTMTLELHCPLLEKSKVATAGLEPNDIKFRVRMEQGNLANSFTNRGLYEGFSISLRENIR